MAFLLRFASRREEGPTDGVEFDDESLEVDPIREGAEYEGLRAELHAHIGSARLRLQVDVGFGDVTVPPPERRTFPGLLDFPEPEVKTYRPETVVAEKLHGIVRFGRANTRLKDFYDIWRISRRMSLEGDRLASALQATFRRRETTLPDRTPVGFTGTFAQESGRARQWEAFLGQLDEEAVQLAAVLRNLRTFLLPVVRAARGDIEAPNQWHPGGPWSG